MRRFVGTIAVAVVLSLSIYAPQSARAVVSTAEPVVILKMANLTTFVDDSGTPVTITSDDGGGAVRTLSGTFSSGAPVSITIYSAAAATVGTTGLQKLATAAESLPPGDGQEQTVTSTAPTKPPKLTPYAAVATSKTTASVAWAPPPGYKVYIANFGDQPAQTGPAASFQTRGLPIGQAFTLQLISTVDRTVAPANTSVPSEDSVLSLNAATLMDGPALTGSALQQLSQTTTALASTSFSYRTFIPYRYLSSSPNTTDETIQQGCLSFRFPGHPHHYSFVGDNRTSAPPPDTAADYRTMMKTTYNWNLHTFESKTRAGQTTVWDLDSNVAVASKYANTTKMTFKTLAAGADYAAIEFVHIANDPFCPSLGKLGSIAYDVTVNMYRDGNVIVRGTHAYMPSHEAWARATMSDGSVGAWNRVFTDGAKTLGCLLGQVISAGCVATVNAVTNVLNPQHRSIDRFDTHRTNYGPCCSDLLSSSSFPVDLYFGAFANPGAYPGGIATAASYPALPVLRLPEAIPLPASQGGGQGLVIVSHMTLTLLSGQTIDTSTVQSPYVPQPHIAVTAGSTTNSISIIRIRIYLSIYDVPPADQTQFNPGDPSAVAAEQLVHSYLAGAILQFDYKGTHNVIQL